MAVNKDGVYIAEDKDFQLISNSYWVYKGEPLEVDITDFVNRKNLTSTRFMFSGSSYYGLSTAVKKVVLGKNSVTSMIDMFYISKATSLDLSSFDTSNVTDMRNMFEGSQATTLDLSSFDTSSVTDMRYMFDDSQATTLDLSSFDTSNVTDMSYMFRGSQATTGYARTQAEADKLNSSSGKPAGLVFVVKRVNKDGVYIAEDTDFQFINDYWVYKGAFLEVDITDFVNSKNLTSTRYMFDGRSTYDATPVKKVVLGKNSVTDMRYMFRDSQATTLDLSSFDTSSVTDMENMFRDSQVTSLDLSSFDTSNVTIMWSMFYGSQATSLDLSSFDTSSVTNMRYMFYDSRAPSLDLSSFDTSNVTDMSYMFDDSQATIGYARTQADADKFNSSSNKPEGLVFVVKRVNKDGVYIAEDRDFQSINGYWVYKGAFLEVDITDFVNRNKLTSTNRMFSGFSTYESTVVTKVVLEKNSVTDMSYTFNNSKATSLDLSSFDTSGVTDMDWMFYNSQATAGYARTQADADRLNSSEGKPAGLVFVVKRVNKDGVYIAEDRDFQSIHGHWVYKGEPLEVDITDFVNNNNLTSTLSMFEGSSLYEATAVKRVVLGKNSVTNMSYMFYGSQATSLDLSSFDTSNVTDMYAMFNSSQATSLDLSSFDTSNVTDMAFMFSGSQATTGYARTQAEADKFNSSSNKPAGLVFVTAFNKDGVYIARDRDFQFINDYWVYKGEPLEVDITDFVNSKNLTSTGSMFDGWSTYEATAVKRVVLGKNSVTDMETMFADSQATNLDLSSFDTSSVTNMTSMFYNSQATNLDLSSFDTSSVTNMAYMLYGSQATSLDLSSFDTASVTNMYAMFYSSQVTSLDLSSFDTSSVTDMSFMFSSSLATSLDLSSFDTSNVTSMSSMFRYSQATTGYARTQADADKFNSSSYKPAELVFVAVVQPSFGTLDNLKIKSMSYKDSNGLIKKVQTSKYKDSLGNMTKLK